MNINNQETSENFHLQEIEGINKTNYELQNRIRQLEKVSASLIEIVEGVSSERWNVDGFRLKDTPEWVEFYVTVRKSK
jgi:hypothetical protein